MAVGALSLAQARRVALTAQGFDLSRPVDGADARHLQRLFDYVGLIRLDTTASRIRAEDLVVYSRLGLHPKGLLAATAAAGDVFEYWGNGAAYIPSEHHRLFRWKMERAADGTNWSELVELQRTSPWFVDDVFSYIEEQGPFAEDDEIPDTWWSPEDGRRAVEYLFWSGRIAARRRQDSVRTYDVPQRVIPQHYLDMPTPDENDARKELLLLAARSTGIASATDLAEYHGQLLASVKPLLRELVEDHRLIEVGVRGWRPTLYLHPDAELPDEVSTSALLSPTDSLLWSRERSGLLLDFHEHREKTPSSDSRSHVMPFMFAGQLSARLELDINPLLRTMYINSADEELGAPVDDVAEAIAEELRGIAEWLGLSEFEFGQRGSLTKPLERAMRGY